MRKGGMKMPIVEGKYKNPGWQNGSAPDIDANELNAMSSTLEKADSTRYDSVTMTAAGWRTKTYSFEAAYPSDTWDIVISVAPTATSAQYDAFAAAKICGSPTRNVVTALGDQPLVNIPLIVKAVRK